MERANQGNFALTLLVVVLKILKQLFRKYIILGTRTTTNRQRSKREDRQTPSQKNTRYLLMLGRLNWGDPSSPIICCIAVFISRQVCKVFFVSSLIQQHLILHLLLLDLPLLKLCSLLCDRSALQQQNDRPDLVFCILRCYYY